VRQRDPTLPISTLISAAFLSAAGARTIDPLLAILSKSFNESVSTTSMTVVSFTMAYGASQILIGPIGDRYGKLRVLLGALIAYAAAMAACASAGSLFALIVLRVGAGAACGGLVPVCLAYLGDWVPYQNRQIALTHVLSGFIFGQMLGGPVGGVLGQWLGWQSVFLLLSFGGLIGAVHLALRMKAFPDLRSRAWTKHGRDYFLLARQPTARSLLTATLVEGAILAGSFPFIAPFLHDVFGLSYAAAGLVLMCFGLGAFVYVRLANRLVSAFGEMRLVVVGGLFLATGFVLAAASPIWPLVAFAEVLLGLGYVTLHSVLQTRATELLPASRTTAVSSFAFMLFLGQGVGTLAMSGIIAWIGYRNTFSLNAIAILPLVGWLCAFLRRSALTAL
jgi:predicted MFS family arabinose efflux permease